MDHFHALLVLEAQIPGAPGSVEHFRAVACYALQHPDSMNYTAEALAGLRMALADELDGRATLDEIRRRTRRAVDGAGRVMRRPQDAAPRWLRGCWPMTVVDVLRVEPTAETYAERVRLWATSVRDTLDVALDT
jgi:hypothetical protein